MGKCGSIFLGPIVFLCTAGAVMAAPVQWNGSADANGHFYGIINNQLTFEAAKAQAAANDGYLVTITSEAESNWIHDVLAGGSEDDGFGVLDGLWIGAFQPSDTTPGDEPARNWQWVTGEVWSWTNWFPGTEDESFGNNEPNNLGGENFAEFAHGWSTNTGVFWNDISGAPQRGYVIEYNRDPTQAPVPEPATLVLFSVGLAGIASFRRKRMVKN